MAGLDRSAGGCLKFFGGSGGEDILAAYFDVGRYFNNIAHVLSLTMSELAVYIEQINRMSNASSGPVKVQL